MKFNFLMVTLAAALVSACSTTPEYDAKFGDAVRHSTGYQIVRPAGKSGPEEAEGQVMNSVIDRYHKSYAVPPQPVNVFNIGVGSN